MAKPTGISTSGAREILVALNAIGQMLNVPPVQLDPILIQAKKDLEEE